MADKVVHDLVLGYFSDLISNSLAFSHTGPFVVSKHVRPLAKYYHNCHFLFGMFFLAFLTCHLLNEVYFDLIL